MTTTRERSPAALSAADAAAPGFRAAHPAARHLVQPQLSNHSSHLVLRHARRWQVPCLDYIALTSHSSGPCWDMLGAQACRNGAGVPAHLSLLRRERGG